VKLLLLLSLSILLAAPAAARNDVPFVDTRDRPAEPVGMRDPQQELALIMKKVEHGELPKIQFEFDSAKILLESYPTLDAIAELIISDERIKVKVLAHTDNVGTEDYNQDLSERRARSVKAHLVKRGVPPPSIRFIGLGSSAPVADNATEEGRALNRRVEFRLSTRDWNAVY
jgi:OOP family OmpA-OmpF porin